MFLLYMPDPIGLAFPKIRLPPVFKQWQKPNRITAMSQLFSSPVLYHLLTSYNILS
jgi:hypothetical protein